MMTQISKSSPDPVDDATSTSRDRCCDLESLLEPRFFKALCDPNRVAILGRLIQCCRPSTVSEIGAESPVSLSVVSRHLAMLREAGILTAEKRGRAVTYSVRYSELVRTLRSLADAIEACCPVDETTTQLSANQDEVDHERPR